MRQHGKGVEVDSQSPRARAVCDRCGMWYNHHKLRWQFEWVGPRLQNLRLLVCDSCYDKPQENIRTIVIPPDPIPIYNARPENYVSADNPMSNIGADANFLTPQYGNRIGTLTGCGGLNAAFDGNINKQAWTSATTVTVSDSSYANYVGINWQGAVSNLSMPSSLYPPVIEHSLSQVVIYAPTDSAFLNNSAGTGYAIQAAPVDTSLYSAWTTLYSGTTAGTAGESITVTSTQFTLNPTSQFHRVAIQGDGTNYVSIAQVEFYVSEVGGDGET